MNSNLLSGSHVQASISLLESSCLVIESHLVTTDSDSFRWERYFVENPESTSNLVPVSLTSRSFSITQLPLSSPQTVPKEPDCSPCYPIFEWFICPLRHQSFWFLHILGYLENFVTHYQFWLFVYLFNIFHAGDWTWAGEVSHQWATLFTSVSGHLYWCVWMLGDLRMKEWWSNKWVSPNILSPLNLLAQVLDTNNNKWSYILWHLILFLLC